MVWVVESGRGVAEGRGKGEVFCEIVVLLCLRGFLLRGLEGCLGFERAVCDED